MTWLDGGPAEWTRRYLRSMPPPLAVLMALVLLVAPLFGRRP